MNGEKTPISERIENCREMLGMIVLAAVNPMLLSLRRCIGFRRPGYRESPETIDPALPRDLLERMDSQRAKELQDRYAFGKLRDYLHQGTFIATIYYTDLVDRVLTVSPMMNGTMRQRELDILEIGCKNFESAPGLFHAFKYASGEQRAIRLTGVELDAYRIYADWHSRHDYAEYYLSLCSDSEGRKHEFLGMDFMDYEGQHDLVVWIRPFLDAYPLLHWGLPRKYLKPEAMFGRMLDCMKPGAVGLIMNQNEEEFEKQQQLVSNLKLEHERHIFALDFTRQAGYQYLTVVKRP